MCGRCGCQAGDAIGALHDEHLSRLRPDQARHVAREERNIVTALREPCGFADEVEALEDEHVALGVAIAALNPHRIGIFPVSVVTPGATGWATVDRAHTDLPTFLTERSPA